MQRPVLLPRGHALTSLALGFALFLGHTLQARAADRPNILWLTYEDSSANLGCYGDKYAITPAVDALAARGVRYTHAFATSGVCAPSRSCLITGVYPSSMGSQLMRCTGNLPDFIHAFPEYLREAGYYCTNNSKTDYNFKHRPGTWDESSNRAHWRKRPDKQQPFFSVFNFTGTHESKTRLRGEAYDKATQRLTPAERRDPAQADLPPYYPDTPEARRDWANNAELITVMDHEVADRLRELEDAGLTDDTIVFVFSDHGVGLPRAKRWLYDSGMHVPLIIHFPEKFQHLAPSRPGSVSDRLVSFVDFGPTVLSLAGVTIPEHMQGRAFLGEQQTKPRDYVFGIRDRMDERYDLIRAVRDHRFKYLRNYMPHLPYDQFLDYAERGHTLKSIRRLEAAGELTGAPALFVRDTKPVEELYDTMADPYEIKNLAKDPQYVDVLKRMRRAHEDWKKETLDVGLLPEPDLRRRERESGLPIYSLVRTPDHPLLPPWSRITETAALIGQGPGAVPKLVTALGDADPAVRHWAATGLLALGAQAKPAVEALRQTLEDPVPHVRVPAAEVLCRLGEGDEGLAVLIAALTSDDEWVQLSAAIALDHLGETARPAIDAMRRTRERDSSKYVARVCNRTLNVLLGRDDEVP